MKKLKDRSKKILVGLLAAFVLYSLAGFFLLPYVIKTVAAKKLAEALHRETSIEKVYFNPYSFNLSVLGFKIMEPGGKGVFASFEELKINLQGRSLIKGGLTVKELTLDRPYVNVVHKKDLTYNFSDLMPKGGPEAKEKAAHSRAPMKFSFNNIRVINGSADFNDLPKQKSHTVREMNVQIPFISSIPSEVEIFVKPSFSAKFNGTKFAFTGESKPFTDSFETLLDINIAGLELPQYLAYSPVPLKFRMPSGTLTAALGLSYKQYRDRAPELTVKGTLKLIELELQDASGGRIVKLPSLAVDIAAIDAFAGKAHLSSVMLERPEAALVRNEDGSMNVMALVPGTGEEKPVEEKKKPAFTLDIDMVALKGARLSFSDLTRKNPFRRSFEPVNAALKGFSTSAGKQSALTLDYRSPSGEGISADGTISVNPVEAEVGIKAEALDIRPVQSYIDDMLNLIVTKGRASAAGKVSAAFGAQGTRLSYRGKAAISGLSTVDKLHGEALVKFGSLALDGIEFDLSPRRVIVGSVVLSDLYSNVAVGGDGRLNLADVMAKPAQQAGPGPVAGAAPQGGKPAYMRIDSVTLKGGTVDFNDRHIEPVFSTSLAGLNGQVKGLYLDGSKLAELSLSGKIDKYAPFEVKGKLNPKKEDLFIDTSVNLNGFDLSAVTPYSGRYIGYGIEKGKIFLDLSYLIEKRKLKAENKVLIDQITLGQSVESPQATKLPVSLAISLLKDRRGQIKLDVPLSGSLDDPQFSVAGIVIQVIFNLIEKAVLSPFSLLGSIFGGGEDLGYVVFTPGSYSISEASAKKLDALVSALYDRPGLKLDIEGFASPEEDAKSLAEYKFMRALKAEKLKETAKGDGSAATADEVTIGKDEFERYLFLAYKKADFRKEKNFFGLTKKLPAPELERLLRAHLAVTDDDLRALAARRSDMVKDYILRSGKVEPSRVFIRWPKSLAPEKKEGLKESRVEFKLE